MADQLLAGIPPVLDDNGDPVAGGSVEFFQTGTTTAVAIWADQAGTIPLTNPLPLAADGRPVQVFYTGSVAVKTVVRNAAGNIIETIDPSPRFSVSAAAASGITFSPVPSNPAENVQDAIENAATAAATDTLSKAGSLLAIYGGTANAITLTTGLGLTAPTVGQWVIFQATTTNTGAVTLKLDSDIARTAVAVNGLGLTSGHISTSRRSMAYYNGSGWILYRFNDASDLNAGTLPAARLSGTYAIDVATLGGLASSDYSPAPFTAFDSARQTFPIGTTLLVRDAAGDNRTALVGVNLSTIDSTRYVLGGGGGTLLGSWRARGFTPEGLALLVQRVS